MNEPLSERLNAAIDDVSAMVARLVGERMRRNAARLTASELRPWQGQELRLAKLLVTADIESGVLWHELGWQSGLSDMHKLRRIVIDRRGT